MLKNKLNLILIIFLILVNLSCSQEFEKKSVILEKNIDGQILEAWNEGLKELERGEVLLAAKKFNEVEILFPQSDWAAKSTLMAAYAYYTQDYYFDTIEETKTFLRKYPNHKDSDYANFLMGMAYYDQIIDETKDLNSILMAKKQFETVIKDYPDTDYALDAKFKLDFIADVLAAKEMYIGRYYFNKKKWIPAINRFKTVIKEYDTTIYVEESLYRLVEIHYIIGLNEEAKKYAQLLGYNYQSSKWYEKSYSFFDKKYKIYDEDQKRDENLLIKKFKSLFE